MKQVTIRSLLFILLCSSLSNIYCAAPKGFKALAGGIPQEITLLANSLKGEPNLSSKLPKGILLIGQTGGGKTTIARALSEEVECPFIYKSAGALLADGPQKAVGNIQAAFQEARNKAKTSKFCKSILFIDDFDMFNSPKLSPDIVTLSNEIEGFDGGSDNVLIIAACRSTESFERCLMRAGRFDAIIEILLPNPAEREVIIRKLNEGSSLSFDAQVNMTKIANLAYNFTPADLKQLITYAHICAKKENKTSLSEKHLLEAMILVLQAKVRIDKNLSVRVKVILSILNKKPDDKKGFERLVGSPPDEIKDLVRQIRNDSAFKRFKLQIPRGILFVGPPGTGKTSLARAISEEAGCEFMAASAAEFVNSLVGEGGQKIRELFKEARQKAVASESKKTILFLDELDSIGKRQGNLSDATITELLTQMDGFEEDDSIIVIAASNHPKNIDPALLRAGRFSKIINIGLPSLETRELFLKTFTQGIPLASDVNLKKIAQVANNFSPADLKELVQKTSSDALKAGVNEIKESHFVQALRKALSERALKGEKDIQQQIDSLEVTFGGKESKKGFAGLVGGVEPAVEDLVKMIKGEYDFARFGVPFPKGILLAGPPGTGKTTLARALAEESGCEFMQAKGSDFIEKYVGVGAQRVRELFTEARTKAEGNRFGKTIIFIDEIDAIGSRSGNSDGGGAQESRQTVTELLGQMDGFYKDNSVIVIAATNAPVLLDPALLRAGRFDTIIEIPLPNFGKRKALFEFYSKKRPVDAAISFDVLATATEGCNAADIKNIVDKAAQSAMRYRQSTITQANLEQALIDIKAAEGKKKAVFV